MYNFALRPFFAVLASYLEAVKIKKLHSEGKTFKYTRDLPKYVLITNAKNFSPKAKTRGRNKKTVERTDNLMLRSVKKRSFITSTQIKTELDLPIRKRLIAANLKARSP